MRLTRRGWIGASVALAGASAAQAQGGTAQGGTATTRPPMERHPAPPPARFQIRSPGNGHNYDAALEALAGYARAELAAVGLPGMTLSVTDQEGFVAVLALGWADVERRIPVAPRHYFQIGSISKSFVALTLLVLAGQGKVDLDAPMARYLPDAPLPAEPITVAQVLSHTAGLPDGAPVFPRTPDGRLWTGFKPGTHFSYSNTGYELLGRVIEQVTGLPHQVAVQRLVREPLGLADIQGVVSQAARPRFAVGYWPWDRVAAGSLPGARLEFASWDEEDTPAGSIGATSEQMAVYLRTLLALGRGHGAPLMPDALARRFGAPVIPTDEFGPGARYALGVAVTPIDGADCLHHTGGMMSFSSAFHADPAAGVAAFASVNARNAGYRPRMTTAYAVRLMRAARTSAALPPAPDPETPYRFKDADVFVGRFVGPGGEAFTLTANPQGLWLDDGKAQGRVVPEGPTRLVTDHPRFGRFGFDAVMAGGKVTGLWWGPVLFGLGAAPPQPTPDPRLLALAGDYLNRDPWVGGATILVRGSDLIADGLGKLVERGGYWTAEQDPGGVERIRFDALLNGKARRANVSGADLLRVTV